MKKGENMNRKRNATEGPCWLGLFLLVAGWMLIPSMASAQPRPGSNSVKTRGETGGDQLRRLFLRSTPLCYALIPGCDCGEGMNFGEDGCFKDPEACEGFGLLIRCGV